MDDCIIEGIDTFISDEEIVNNWDATATRKIINKLSVCDNEKVLDDVLKDYLWVLQHHARNSKTRKLLKDKIITHVKVFHLCCITTSNLPTELQSYWENMENVLVILCNLELDLVRNLKLDNIKVYKEKIVELTTNLIYLLSVFLLGNNTRICHVLLKLKVRYDSRAWKDVMKVVYRHFLVMVPIKDKTEENFCRNYLLFQNYKKLVHKENHVKMDSVLFERFNMSHDDICKSRTLKKILLPSPASLTEVVDILNDGRETAVEHYFLHIDRKSKDDDYIPFSINLDSDSEDEVQLSVGNDSGVGEIKIENIEQTTNSCEGYHIICVDDDSDVEEISLPIVSKTVTKAPSSDRIETYVSFLDSIKISDEFLEESTCLITDDCPPITESVSSPENNIPSPSLPLLELYIDNLKNKGHVLNTLRSKEFDSNNVDISSESSSINNNQPKNVLSNVRMEINTSLSSPAQKQPAESIEELNIEVCPITAEIEPSRTPEKSLDSPTNNDHFSFISGLITPPVSDRANDDVSADLNDIPRHKYASEMEIAINNCVTISHSPLSNELGIENCIVTEENIDNNTECEVINTSLTEESQENLITSKQQVELDKTAQVRKLCINAEIEQISVDNCVTISSCPSSGELGNESYVVTEENIDENTECEGINTSLNPESQENVTTSIQQLELDSSRGIEGDSELEQMSTFETEEPVVAVQVEKLIINAEIEPEPISFDNCVTTSPSPLSDEDNVDENTECEDTNTSLSPEPQENVITPNDQLEPDKTRNIQRLDKPVNIHDDAESEQISTPETDEPAITAQIEKLQINADMEPNPSERVSENKNVSSPFDIILPMGRILDKSQSVTPEIVLTVVSPGSVDIENEESQSERLTENEDRLVNSENLIHEDMILDESLLTSEITETILTNTPVVPILKSPSFSDSFRVSVASGNVKKDQISLDVGYGNVDEMNQGSRNGSYQNACKIQASVSMNDMINGVNIKIGSKLKDGHFSNVSKTKPSTETYRPEKVLYTTTERVSAPLSLFSKFEQTQSELMEKAFSGPIAPIYSYPDVPSDLSSSDDSLHSFPYVRLQAQAKQVGLCKADSPISPMYEQIQSQEFENHILSVDYDHLINSINSPVSHISKTSDPKSNLESGQEVMNGRKRKLDLGTNQQKKSKVNFGPTEVRIIPPREDPKLIEDEVLEEASESMKEYKIGANDVKLVYLQPQIPIKIESASELQEKEQQLKIRGLLHNANSKANGNSCILKRIDYKKMASQMEHSVNSSQRNFGHKISNLIGNKPTERTRIDTVPSGYIPPINSYPSVHGLQSNTALEQQQTFNNQQNQTSNTFNDNCNSEILNLSVSSKIVSELDSPESEFSRSPKLLQNSDQIVQRCLIDNLDNNEIEPLTNVHNSIAFLSNNSNFYSTPHQIKPTNVVLPPTGDARVAKNSDTIDKYRNDLEELLLKNEIDKLIDDKLINSESEFSLPLKKRRVLPKLNETVQFKEEISYPATPMISIAEIEALHQNTVKNSRSFKTPAERKEMPPIPFIYNKNSSEPTPIITDQFNINNHTYNNPTINYHMSSVPLPFINVPCAPYYSLPPFLLPFNNVTTYDTNLSHEGTTCFKKEDEPPKVVKTVKKQKNEKKKRTKRAKEFFEQYVPDKKFIF
ncbi:hypothetical protein FQR65_LT04735 [Abscondita terminalis]|nr:hypothetical protein FQR65_LT04735 [Abscondita terminalis]